MGSNGQPYACTLYVHTCILYTLYLLLRQTQVQLKMVAYSSMLRYILLFVLLNFKFTVLIRINKN